MGKQQTPKRKDVRTKRGHLCCAYWCSRRSGSNNGMAMVPGLFRGHASKLRAAALKKEKRNKLLKSLCRADVVHAEVGVNLCPAARTRSEKAIMQPGADYQYCKLHTGEHGAVLPLLRDPVMLGTTTGLNSAAVDKAAAHTAVGVARDKIAADRNSPTSNRADRLMVRQTSVNGAAPIGPW